MNVDLQSKKTVLLVGSGKLARHLKHWVTLPSCHFSKTHILTTWDRSQSLTLLMDSIQKADLIWLAIADDQILPFYEQHLQTHSHVVHFSGALYDAQLNCAHPLMTFGPHLYDGAVYQEIQFGLTGCADLQQVLPGFSNLFFQIPADIKPLYHALCVVAGNFPQMLWREVHQQCLKNEIPFSAFEPLLKNSLQNSLRDPERALTGPFARKDINTIEKNISVLSQPLKKIYQTFTEQFMQRTFNK